MHCWQLQTVPAGDDCDSRFLHGRSLNCDSRFTICTLYVVVQTRCPLYSRDVRYTYDITALHKRCPLYQRDIRFTDEMSALPEMSSLTKFSTQNYCTLASAYHCYSERIKYFTPKRVFSSQPTIKTKYMQRSTVFKPVKTKCMQRSTVFTTTPSKD